MSIHRLRTTAFVVVPALLLSILALAAGGRAEADPRVDLGAAYSSHAVDVHMKQVGFERQEKERQLRQFYAEVKRQADVAAWQEAERINAENARKAEEARRAREAAQRRAAQVQAASAAPAAPADVGGDCMANHGPKWRMPSKDMAHRCWDGLLAQYGWDQSVAFDKLWCESGGNPYAVGPQTRYGVAQGLMQILPGGSFDPATNMAQAWEKYQARGWQPWQC